MSAVVITDKEGGWGTYVSEGEQGTVEEEDDAEEHEQPAEGRQRHADLCAERKSG